MDVRLPKLGEGAESGTVVSIMVKEGDTIEEGQTLLELENEKAVAPIPSPAAGKVSSIRVKEGDKLSVGQVILTVTEGGETGARADSKAKLRPEPGTAPDQEGREPARREAAGEEEQEQAEREPDPKSGLAPAASPAIRKMAREL